MQKPLLNERPRETETVKGNGKRNFGRKCKNGKAQTRNQTLYNINLQKDICLLHLILTKKTIPRAICSQKFTIV